jgi:hypothetical protein
MTRRTTLAVPLGLVLLAGSGATAWAQCRNNPSAANCDNKDPQAQGCNWDAITLAQRPVCGPVVVELRYSPSCQSKWTKAYTTNGALAYMRARVHRNGAPLCWPGNCQSFVWTNGIYTSMFYSPQATHNTAAFAESVAIFPSCGGSNWTPVM